MPRNSFPLSTLFHYPILLVLADGEEHTQKEFRNKCIEVLQISKKNQEATLQNGRNKVVSWTDFAVRNLKDAGLLTTQRGSGKYKITDAGRKLLSLKPDGFRGATGKGLLAMMQQLGITPNEQPATYPIPEENSSGSSESETSITVKLSDLAASANANLPDALLEAVKQMSPKAFEVLIKKLLIAMGYGNTQDDVIVTQYVRDDGIDGYVRKDRLDVEKLCAYQAKRYSKTNVGIQEMNELGGAMINCGTRCGIFVTTTDFSSAAKSYDPRGYDIKRIDGKTLVGYLIEYGIGVKTEQIEVKTVDLDFLKNL